ncbi:hypothetical protein [Lachnoclostridium phytofermentans]|uniref:Uncharacterized protein n=1 Tax=Lachnoclostridium phytofermentans (strain ATCC 700394 / DSM 18823 / ISDg) TaxID=357809 RepID=A9KL94_LACP7|nr:hypothetical protein [Lachnoclostridium phytofermentans]ABX44243.1 hypothetical protein Cphy_3896 [Lachnoclostridium phytofermentans ISDg]
MTNYKRFVSYFYQYDSGRKNNNTGYARIETSDEMCKVSLNCNIRTIPGRACRVYFVKRNRDQAEGILVGTAITKADGVEARVTMPRGVMEDTKVRFYEVTGIVVCFSKDNYFVTEWDDIPITYHQVASFEDKVLNNREEEKEKVESRKQPSVVEIVDTKTEKVIEVVEVLPESSNLVSGTKNEDKERLEKVDNTEAVLDNAEISFDNSLENIEDTVENSIVTNDAGVQEETIVLDEDRVTQGNVVEQIENAIVGDESDESQIEEIKAADITDSQSSREEISEDSNGVEKGREDERKEANKEVEFMVSSIEAARAEGSVEADELVLDDNDEMVNAADCKTTPSMSEKDGWCDHPSARSIMDRFPHMYPFDDGEITECVRIEPKDLGLLPMDSWVLGNNSFLLHSFSTYRHLLFARKMSREGIYYMIMVPGAYNIREKHMAGMFGFKDFKCSRRRKLRDGDFGYWYAYIDYSNASTF